jgi:hypothetical protein
MAECPSAPGGANLATDASSAPTGAQVVLGVFILGQLAFLLAANVLELLQAAREELPPEVAAVVEPIAPGWANEAGHIHDVIDLVRRLTKRWSQLTGQPQSWSLFAPNAGHNSTFVAVELRWDPSPPLALQVAKHLAPLAFQYLSGSALLYVPGDVPAPPAPVVLLSENEAADINRYFRWGRFRLRRFEGNLDLALDIRPGETPAQARERWRDKIREHAAVDGDAMEAYVRWRWRHYQQLHPGQVAPQLVLLVRRYAIVPPGEGPPFWTGPHVTPLARWQPQAAGAPGDRPVEVYNPVTSQFEPFHP